MCILRCARDNRRVTDNNQFVKEIFNATEEKIDQFVHGLQSYDLKKYDFGLVISNGYPGVGPYGTIITNLRNFHSHCFTFLIWNVPIQFQ